MRRSGWWNNGPRVLISCKVKAVEFNRFKTMISGWVDIQIDWIPQRKSFLKLWVITFMVINNIELAPCSIPYIDLHTGFDWIPYSN